MSSLNKVILIGNLGRDPEGRSTQSGERVISFSLATTESWRDKASGDRKDRTEWHNVVCWNEALGKIIESYCKKGSKVYLEGQLQTREYTDKDGNQRRVTEVVLQRFRGELVLLSGRQDDEREQPRGSSAARVSSGRRATTSEAINDDIPF